MTDEPLTGRQLAETAYPVCQELDPEAKGLKPQVIHEALVARGIAIAGANPRQTLNSTLNKHQDLFKGGPNYTWVWTEPSYDPTQGLSGAALAEEAYRVMAVHDRDRSGMHYGKLLRLLLDEGVLIRGGNRGNTLFTALQNADHLFTWVGSGTFRIQ
jgi:hypothetical protein